MIAKLLMASCLVATTVIIHATGLCMVLGHVLHSTAQPDTRFWPMTWLLIRIAWFLVVIHLFEITVWGLFFWWQNCLPDAGSSDRKSTRLNSSHLGISYAVFCLKTKTI